MNGACLIERRHCHVAERIGTSAPSDPLAPARLPSLPHFPSPPSPTSSPSPLPPAPSSMNAAASNLIISLGAMQGTSAP